MFKKNTNSTITTYLKGFTLAEVLITLAIIGIVAAMTIPSLLNNVSNAREKAALNNAFSFLNDVILSLASDGGGSIKDLYPGDGLGSEAFKNAIASKLNTTKICSGTSATFGGTGSGGQAEGCWHAINKWYNYNGTARSTSFDNPGMILSNGYLIEVGLDKTDCSAVKGSYTRCGGIIIDINGFAPPNTLGKDIFAFSVLENRILPEGALGYNDPATTCVSGSANAANTGSGCTYKILYEN